MHVLRIKANITGAKDFISLNNEIIKDKNMTAVRDTIMLKIYYLIKEYAPVKTGELEDSIKIFKKGNEYTIIVSVPYAEYMEYGTKYFPVGTADAPRARTSTSGKACFHPFVRSAVWITMNEFPEIVKKALFSKI